MVKDELNRFNKAEDLNSIIIEFLLSSMLKIFLDIKNLLQDN